MQIKEAPIATSIPELIKEALDGRTQRWLCFNAKIPESNLSKKMKGKEPFSEKELQRINNALKISLPLNNI